MKKATTSAPVLTLLTNDKNKVVITAIDTANNKARTRAL
jgi:hypothetical protein